MFVNYSKMSLVINNFLIHNKKRIIFSLNDKFVLVKYNTIYIYDLEIPIKYNCDILAKKILKSKELPFNYKYKIYGLDRNKQATIFSNVKNLVYTFNNENESKIKSDGIYELFLVRLIVELLYNQQNNK